MSTRVSRLTDSVARLRSMRCADLLVVQNLHHPLLEAEAKEIVDTCNLTLIDYREEILKRDARVIPGAYHRTALRDWIKQRAAGDLGLLIVHADEVIGPWEAADRRNFFWEFLHIDCRVASASREAIPIVLVTSHVEAEGLEPSGLGQGLVVSLASL